MGGDIQKPQRVVVNQAFVHHFFPSQMAVGKLFGNRGADGLATANDQIIGVVSDAKYRSLRENVPLIVYAPATGGFDSSFILHLRTRAQPASVIGPVRDVLRALDPELPVIEVRMLREEVETSLWQERLLAWLSTLFSCFAALLTGIGLYGALDFAVKNRTREIGVRVALGADPFRVVQLLGRETALLIAAGIAVGIGGYAAATRWIRQLLYGLAVSDPLALGSSILFVVVIALLAISPAIWRAARTEPAAALRHD